MKKWSNEEIAELKRTVVEHGTVSQGIRAFMITHPERSFQACSHVIYRKQRDEEIHEVPAAAEVVNKASTEAPSIPEKKSFWKKLIGLFIKSKAVL